MELAEVRRGWGERERRRWVEGEGKHWFSQWFRREC